MPTAITRDDVHALLARGAQLVDVLAAEEYAEEHLPGATNVPLKTLDAASTVRLHKDGSVIAYCHDLQ
jgi:rhodanese-related sulfurtransferase